MTGLLSHTGTQLPGMPHATDRCTWIPAPSPPAPEPGSSQKSALAPGGHSPNSGVGQAGPASQLGPFLTGWRGSAPSLKICGH